MDTFEIEELLKLYGDDVYRFCLRLENNIHDAEDLYQQTFLKLCVKNYTMDYNNNPKSLIFSIAYYIHKDNQRKNARRNKIAPQSQLDNSAFTLSINNPDQDNQMIENETKREMMQVINSLPEKFKTPIVLHYQFEESTEAIAKILKIPQGTVKSRLAKARQLIKKELEEFGYGR